MGAHYGNRDWCSSGMACDGHCPTRHPEGVRRFVDVPASDVYVEVNRSAQGRNSRSQVDASGLRCLTKSSLVELSPEPESSQLWTDAWIVTVVGRGNLPERGATVRMGPGDSHGR